MPAGLVTVDSFVSVVAASLARARLEAEGIRCHVANEHMAALRDGLGPAMLQVDAEDAERAREILREPSAEPRVDPEDGPVCPQCHGQYAETRRSLRSWVASLLTRGRRAVTTYSRCRKCGHAWVPAATKRDPYRS